MKTLPEFSIEGKKAIVTGPGRGIGKAIALTLAEAGVDVCVAARSRDELDAVAEEIRGMGRRARRHSHRRHRRGRRRGHGRGGAVRAR